MTSNHNERAQRNREAGGRLEHSFSTSPSAGGDTKARQRNAARERMRRLRERRKKGEHDYHVRLFRNAAEALHRLRLLDAEEVGDRARVEQALSDFVDFAIHMALKDNRPG